MQWYYLSDSHERIAASDAQLPLLASRGVLRASTLLWRRGMAGWAPCGEVRPELFAAGVAREGEQRHPAADALAVRGAVTGLARTLAGYSVWFWISGVLCLLLALGVMAGLAQVGWLAVDRGVKVVSDALPWSRQMEERDFTTVYTWAVLGLAALGGLVLCALGVLLLRAASRAVRARDGADEPLLAGALGSLGAWFATGTVWLLVNIIFWVSLTLWLGWEDVWKNEEAKPASALAV